MQYDGSWLLEPDGRIELSAFLRSLTMLLDSTSILVLDGGICDDEVRAFVQAHAPERKPDHRAPRRAWLWMPFKWPFFETYVNERLYVSASAEVLEGLAELSEIRPDPEVCAELLAYEGDRLILEFDDVPTGAVFVSGEVPEGKVKPFCEAVGLGYARYDET